MATAKTQKSKASVKEFLEAIPDPQKRQDAKTVDAMMREITGEKPALWGPSIVGYGSYQYVYASGNGGDWPIVGFSPRKAALTLYIMAGFARYDELMAKLGKFTTGKSCLYLKKLSDVDPVVLRELISASVEHMRKKDTRKG